MGLHLLSLKKGDKDDLVGRVIAYAWVRRVPDDYLTATYSCVDPLDFREKFGEEQLAIVQSQTNQILEQLGWEQQDAINENFPFYFNKVRVTERELENVPEDVLCVGKFNNETRAGILIYNALTIYRNLYLDQRENKLGSAQGVQQEEAPDTYLQMVGKGHFNVSFDWAYVDPIVQGLKNKDEVGLQKIVDELILFSRECDITKPTLDLAAVLLDNNPDERLVQQYFKMIKAIATNRYEDAAEAKNIIDQIRNP